jgi:hypothetical protein
MSITLTLSTGEPDAGDPPVRFGGRGRTNHSLPTPIMNLKKSLVRSRNPLPMGSGHVQLALPVGVMPLENTHSNGENFPPLIGEGQGEVDTPEWG